MLVYPVVSSSVSDPIVIDVVKGQTALLECIAVSARIVWTRVTCVILFMFKMSILIKVASTDLTITRGKKK